MSCYNFSRKPRKLYFKSFDGFLWSRGYRLYKCKSGIDACGEFFESSLSIGHAGCRYSWYSCSESFGSIRDNLHLFCERKHVRGESESKHVPFDFLVSSCLCLCYLEQMTSLCKGSTCEFQCISICRSAHTVCYQNCITGMGFYGRGFLVKSKEEVVRDDVQDYMVFWDYGTIFTSFFPSQATIFLREVMLQSHVMPRQIQWLCGRGSKCISDFSQSL